MSTVPELESARQPDAPIADIAFPASWFHLRPERPLRAIVGEIIHGYGRRFLYEWGHAMPREFVGASWYTLLLLHRLREAFLVEHAHERSRETWDPEDELDVSMLDIVTWSKLARRTLRRYAQRLVREHAGVRLRLPDLLAWMTREVPFDVGPEHDLPRDVQAVLVPLIAVLWVLEVGLACAELGPREVTERVYRRLVQKAGPHGFRDAELRATLTERGPSVFAEPVIQLFGGSVEAYVDTRLSTSTNPRLAAAELVDGSRVGQLPGIVYVERHEVRLDPGGDLREFQASLANLVNTVARTLEMGALEEMRPSWGNVRRRLASGAHRVRGDIAEGVTTRLQLARAIEEGDLTPRERQVLALRLRDLSTAEIAARLGVTQTTVRTLILRVRRRLRTTARLADSLSSARA